jgi:hypothetical protein
VVFGPSEAFCPLALIGLVRGPAPRHAMSASESRAPSPEPPAPSPQVPGPPAEDPPPILGSWRAIYAVVLGELALCIALFWLFGRVFA